MNSTTAGAVRKRKDPVTGVILLADRTDIRITVSSVAYTKLQVRPRGRLRSERRRSEVVQPSSRSGRVQVLLKAFPDIRAATGFWDAVSTDQWKATQLAAQKLGLKLAGIEFRKQPYDYEHALAQVPPDHRDALIVMTSPALVSDRSQLSEFAIKHRMRSIGVAREFADAGCLLTYGANFAQMYARAADYIDRIAKGTLPADLPIELPTKFELVVNLKTAKALGISLSPMLIARADEVIE